MLGMIDERYRIRRFRPGCWAEAGDAFNGAFAAALAGGAGPLDAAQFASAAAAISVTRRGALPSTPTQSEVNLFSVERSKEQPELTV